MPTRTVTGTIYHDDNSPWASGVIKFILISGFATSTIVYPAETHSETLDANGQFSITLAVPDSGTAHYVIEKPNNVRYEIYLASGAATTLQSLLTIASSPVDQNAVQTLIDANNVLNIVTKTTTYVWEAGVEVVRGNGTFAITLPDTTTLTLGQALMVTNVGSGTLTVSRAGSDTIGVNNDTSWSISSGMTTSLFYGSSLHWDAIY